jgi:hypothetical protein
MRRIGLWLGLAMAAAAPAASAQSLADARAFVAGLYRGYAENHDVDYLDKGARRVFSPRLLGLIRADERAAHGEVGWLDGDPICDCQDPDGIRLVGLDVAPDGPGRAEARVRVRFAGGERRSMRLDLVSVGGSWHVDDVRTKDTPSLARALREHPGGR